jgi:hypothetical protein
VIFNFEERFPRVLGGIKIAVNLAKKPLSFGGSGHQGRICGSRVTDPSAPHPSRNYFHQTERN